jgi:hypothetical protein
LSSAIEADSAGFVHKTWGAGNRFGRFCGDQAAPGGSTGAGAVGTEASMAIGASGVGPPSADAAAG